MVYFVMVCVLTFIDKFWFFHIALQTFTLSMI